MLERGPGKSRHRIQNAMTVLLATFCVACGGGGGGGGSNQTSSVELGNWLVAALLENDDSGDVTSADLALDPNGKGVAVWEQSDGSVTNIWADRFTPAGGWAGGVLVETDDTGDADTPVVALDANGNGLAVWVQSFGIWASRFSSVGTWDTPVQVSATNGAEPKLAIAPGGEGFTVWRHNNGSFTDLYASQYTSGSGWSTPELIETEDLGEVINPEISAGPAGTAMAVWAQNDGSNYNIWANHYTPGSGWDGSVKIEVTSGLGQFPHVAFDPAGNAIAVWAMNDGLIINIWSNRYTAGVGWGTAELIETDDAGPATTPRVAIDQDGNALAVWAQSDGTVLSILANRYTAGGGWGTPELIETDDTSFAQHPRLAMNAQGDALAVWRQSDGTRIDIWSNRYVNGSGWGTAERIETGDDGDGVQPRVALDSNAEGLAVWFQGDGTRDNAWSNRFE